MPEFRLGLLEAFLAETQELAERQSADEVRRTAVRILRRCLDNLNSTRDNGPDVILREDVVRDENLNERLQ